MWGDTYINSIYLREYEIFNIQYFPFEFSFFLLSFLFLRLKINSANKELNSNASREKDSLFTLKEDSKSDGMVRWLSNGKNAAKRHKRVSMTV